MPARLRTGPVAAAGLLLGCLALALAPAAPALASGQVCLGVVVDQGGGAAPVVAGAQVAPGTSDLQALSAIGQTPAENAAGLVCAIDAYPANGLQNCLSASNGLYFYWSYWEGDPYTNTWTYAQIGPAEHTVSTGQTYVEGWRYQDPGLDNAGATKPSVSPAAAFAQACQGVAPVAPGSGGGAGSGSAAGSGGSGSTAPPTTTPTTDPGSGASPAPVSGAGSTSPGGGGHGGTAGATAPAGGAHAGTTPGSAAAAGAGSAGSPAASVSTTTLAGTAAHTAAPATYALSTAASRRRPGGVSALPVAAVSVVIAIVAVAAWLRWRRRPAEQ